MKTWLEERLAPAVLQFLLNPIDPGAMLEFERSLEDCLRELGRQVLEWSVNGIEPEEASEAPHDVKSGTSGYRRLEKKTPNRDVATVFGRITLWRCGYRSWDRNDGESVLFPLELQLGLVEKTTPALADHIGKRVAEAGSTQQTVLEWLRRDHDVAMGVPRLRRLSDQLAENLDRHREHWQVAQLIQWLHTARASRGRHKPVFAVGRDGVTFHVQGVYEVGSTATVSVYDRRGKRLGTVYLAEPSERHQATLSQQLTSLILATLKEWDGPQPRLCYVTDAGDAETSYYYRSLRPMRDPKCPARRLQWIRVVDYFHASERISVMAKALCFTSERDRASWVKRMRKLLKQPGGAGRVLHSAAALRSRLGLREDYEDTFTTACNYLRNQRKFINYSDYKAHGLPIGSGVTEAACKTVFTQRLKLSGQQWTRSGARTILHLRVILLSGIWDDAYNDAVRYSKPSHIVVRDVTMTSSYRKSA